MSLNPVKVAQEVASGLSVVCATCSSFWKGKDAGLSFCLSTRCGGPIAGKTFSDYDGPLSEDRLAEFCFVCGSASGYGVVVEGHKRRLNVCRDHVELLVNARGRQPRNKQVFLVSDGVLLPVERLFQRPQKQTFWEFFTEVETYYANKEGRPL